jgi:hypothetical protein
MRGGHNSTGRIETERTLALDTTEFACSGVFEHNRASYLQWTQPRHFTLSRSTTLSKDIQSVQVGYVSPAAQKYVEYPIYLTTTPCNYGGKRYWFICPLAVNGVTCGKRVGCLYLCGIYFGCRYCYNLTYTKCNRGQRYKSLVTMRELREKLCGVLKTQYEGKPTKKLLRYLKTEKRFLQTLKNFNLLPGRICSYFVTGAECTL